MKFSLQNQTQTQAPESLFTEILDRVDKRGKVLELLLTDNAEIQKLNKKYRKKDEPTDVLSFPLDDPNLLGQIVISVDRAKQQAIELNQPLSEELKFLFAHGLLHLLGHDHQNPEEEKIMLAKTYEILNRKK